MAIILFVFGIVLCFVLHRTEANSPRLYGKVLTGLTAAAVVLLTIFPMTLAPLWNGTIQGHRNQYELMAESLIEGRLYIDYPDVDPKLSEMENPYAPNARNEAGVSYHWDHAWYNGHYYMYFGVVPVMLLFLPFRIITGHALNTMHATQVFAGIGVIGLFALFRLLARRFFPKMTLGTYLILSTSLSIVSFWYAAGFPALYCTAISSGVCMMIWSFYFFFKAVYEEPAENLQIIYAALGSLFGGLAFGCRPSVALANLLVIPLLFAYLRRKKAAGALRLKLAVKLLLAALPYFFVAASLMFYNYARFDNPFEFGQSYQLTVADQHNYGSFLSMMDPVLILNGITENLFMPSRFQTAFPWLNYGGACWSFPLLLFGAAIFLPKNLRVARKEKIAAVMIGLFLLPLLITMIDVLWSPFMLERYQMDIYYLMGITAFLSIGFIGEQIEEGLDTAVFRGFVSLLSLAAIMSALLLWLVPYDSNYTQYVEGALGKAAHLLFFLKS